MWTIPRSGGPSFNWRIEGSSGTWSLERLEKYRALLGQDPSFEVNAEESSTSARMITIRQELLRYNMDDVEATFSLERWMRGKVTV